MSTLIELAKKWADKPNNFNEVQFLEAFNELSEDEQYQSVKSGSELSSILLSWSVETRMEIEEERKNHSSS